MALTSPLTTPHCRERDKRQRRKVSSSLQTRALAGRKRERERGLWFSLANSEPPTRNKDQEKEEREKRRELERMYGDCQVLSSLEMNSPESSIFSSQMQNPSSLGFLPTMPFHAFSSLVPKEEGFISSMGGTRETTKEEEMDSGGSGSGNIDEFCSFGEEELERDHSKQQVSDLSRDPLLQPPQNPGTKKKKRYHRHTAHQIQEMEALFKECPHPDDKQRLKLSQELGLKPRQVKFWFQNRRTQMKAHQDRSDNVVLRAENESLKHENFRLQGAIRNVACPNCGSPAVLGEISFDEQHLRIENARLKDELERLTCIASRYTGRPLTQSLGPTMPLLLPPPDLDMNIWPRHFNDNIMMTCNPDLISSGPPITLGGHTSSYMGPIVADQDKPFVLDLAATAVTELLKMGRASDPLWVRKSVAEPKEVLNLEEYKKGFHWPINVNQHDDVAMCTEATRDTAVVIMNSITLVDAFLDANKWMELFPSIVSKARTVQVITPGISGQANGSLILMNAELQFLSPLVPAREFTFFRYCQQNAEEGTWTLVDFPADGFNISCSGTPAALKCRRCPSGCIIQDMPNGYSRVTWVEHCEVEDKPINPTFYKFVKDGSAFGATCWVSLLQRQCERLASLMARNVSDLGVVIPNPEARKNLMKLSQRMIRMFCANVSSSGSQSWTALSESQEDTIRVMTRKNTEPGQPNGVILTAVSTTWLPIYHFQVFELLTDEQKRSQLDILSSGNSLHEVAHIANGSHPRNCVSLLRINAASNSSQNVELLVQESSTHSITGSLVVFATLDIEAVQLTMSGEDPSYIPLLPMGFVISPSPNPMANNTATSSSIPSEGCLLTVGMQVLASAVPSAKLSLASVSAINNHINNAVRQISTALGVAGHSGPAP
ncbi:hypothetical protein LUZ60_014250 [Juncus effusus]|nr:hypothetical protein LUZ60_014250 [Juncus effusus]